MRGLVLLIGLLLPVVASAQQEDLLFQQKKVAIQDSIQLDSLSINPFGFQISNTHQQHIPATAYRINYAKAMLFLKDSLLQITDSLIVSYRRYPSFLTQKYYQFKPSRIVPTPQNKKGLYVLGKNHDEKDFEPFSGLNTTGSISRGITAGTNQNSVLNSKLDLQISGKISDKVRIRASIQDADIPIRESGYSQNLNEFDQVFIELFSHNWGIRGGDIDLAQENSYFGNFHKKIQGLSVHANLNPNGDATHIFAAGGLVRGVFTRNEFVGQEGNQGPYKLHGPNGQLFALIVSGSESVYVNGMLLKRGEHEDYTIDYNAGEIRFNPTYPITSDMRITVEFQYADRNYARIVATGGAEHRGKDWEIGGFIYSENDLRNQPLQQDLSDAQKYILAQAGDNDSLMVAPSVVKDKFSENKVLYKKDTLNGTPIFVYSINPNDQLYRVKFSLVGQNQGDYVIASETGISTIYKYVSPVGGIPQGNYAPLTRLYAPTKLQMAVIHGGYHPSEKTNIRFELAASLHDKNLFSSRNDGNNQGLAGHLEATQNLFTGTDSTRIDAFATVDFMQNRFQSIEPLYNVEFNRDWNLINPQGDKTYLNAGILYTHPQHGFARYNFQQLSYAHHFKGTRQVINAHLQLGKLTTDVRGSFLNSNGSRYSSTFSRLHTQAVYHYNPFWSGVRFDTENNQQTDKLLDSLTGLSQKYSSYTLFTGVGDSTAIYAEVGYTHRVTDSLYQARLQQVARSDNYYVRAQLLNSAQAHLSIYVNYRQQKRIDQPENSIKSLNSRVLYHQFWLNRFLNWNTTYQTSSGTLPQQQYTYVEVDPGKGRYTWNDYNNDGVQDLGEFEIAPFPDEATYVRVFLPNRIFIKTRRNMLSQLISLNFSRLDASQETPSWWSHFYNQTSYLVDRRVKREGNSFNLNPFHVSGEELATNLNFRNTLYFNRGKQHYSTSYTYISSVAKNLLSTGIQESKLESHQLKFRHQLKKSWLFNYTMRVGQTSNHSESFHNRDYRINDFDINPKISYLLNENTQFSLFYQYSKRRNELGNLEQLSQQKIGASFRLSKAQKYAFSGAFNYVYNQFSGNAFSPVAYEMLQGLQPNQNFTWQVLFQKRITHYLDLNIAYYGRKSEGSPVIHTGSVQLKAYF